MRAPTLAELPPPPRGNSGWPWTEESERVPAAMSDGSAWPRISVVTPSFNQAPFLEATLRSILLQGYSDLELFVMDGGSTDGSVDIIRKYETWIAKWVSERDGGQSAAINRGLGLSSGTFATWINSDDMLHQHALTSHATSIGFVAGTVYVGDCVQIDQHGRWLGRHRGRVHSFEDLVSVRTVWRNQQVRGHIVQPEVLFPTQLFRDVGGLDADKHWAMDYELWGKFLLASAPFEYTHIPFGIFRLHEAQKTGQAWVTTQALIATATDLVNQAPALPADVKQSLTEDLQAYLSDYWRRTGWLAQLGLPPGIVTQLRDRRAALRRRLATLVGHAH